MSPTRVAVGCILYVFYVLCMYSDVFSRAISFYPLAFALIVVYVCMYFACIMYVFSVIHLKIHLALTRAFAEIIVCSFPDNTSSNVCVCGRIHQRLFEIHTEYISNTYIIHQSHF